VTEPNGIIDLAAAIEGLRSALTEAVDQGAGRRMQFRIEPIELTMQAVITKDANGKIGWSALGIGGSFESARTQTLTLRLKPIWRADDGTMVDDPLIADQTTAEPRFGPAPDG
jgi:Trypsin-co-occurring domain 2